LILNIKMSYSSFLSFVFILYSQDISSGGVNVLPTPIQHVWMDDYIILDETTKIGWNSTKYSLINGDNNVKYHGEFNDRVSDARDGMSRKFTTLMNAQCKMTFDLIWTCAVENWGTLADTLIVNIKSNIINIYETYGSTNHEETSLEQLKDNLLYEHFKHCDGNTPDSPKQWIDRTPFIMFNVTKHDIFKISFKGEFSWDNEYYLLTNIQIKCIKHNETFTDTDYLFTSTTWDTTQETISENSTNVDIDPLMDLQDNCYGQRSKILGICITVDILLYIIFGLIAFISICICCGIILLCYCWGKSKSNQKYKNPNGNNSDDEDSIRAQNIVEIRPSDKSDRTLYEIEGSNKQDKIMHKILNDRTYNINGINDEWNDSDVVNVNNIHVPKKYKSSVSNISTRSHTKIHKKYPSSITSFDDDGDMLYDNHHGNHGSHLLSSNINAIIGPSPRSSRNGSARLISNSRAIIKNRSPQSRPQSRNSSHQRNNIIQNDNIDKTLENVNNLPSLPLSMQPEQKEGSDKKEDHKVYTVHKLFTIKSQTAMEVGSNQSNNNNNNNDNNDEYHFKPVNTRDLSLNESSLSMDYNHKGSGSISTQKSYMKKPGMMKVPSKSDEFSPMQSNSSEFHYVKPKKVSALVSKFESKPHKDPPKRKQPKDPPKKRRDPPKRKNKQKMKLLGTTGYHSTILKKPESSTDLSDDDSSSSSGLYHRRPITKNETIQTKTKTRHDTGSV